MPHRPTAPPASSPPIHPQSSPGRKVPGSTPTATAAPAATPAPPATEPSSPTAREVIAELSEFLGIRTNNYAEYSGLLACLQYALDHHHPRLRVVSDSELMVKQIQGKYKVNSPDLKPLWQEARNRIARLEAFEITHALRHKNKDADRLANEAMDRGMKRPHAPGQPAPPPLKATPYPTQSEAPPDPYAKADAMLRGFTKDGVVHILGSATLPDGVFVKIIRE